MRFEKHINRDSVNFELEGTPEEIKEILPEVLELGYEFEESDEKLNEVEKVSDKLQLVAHKLDHVREPILQQERRVIKDNIIELKQQSGEEWAIGETIQRILNIEDCENENY